MKKVLTASILLAVILFTAACSGNGDAKDGGTNTVTTPATTTEATPEYLFPKADYGGEEIYFLNTDSKVWGAFSDIVIEEAVGEVLNDAVYDRNQRVEELFNVKLKQSAIHPTEVISKASTLIRAGDDEHAAMFLAVIQ